MGMVAGMVGIKVWKILVMRIFVVIVIVVGAVAAVVVLFALVRKYFVYGVWKISYPCELI